MRLNEFNKNAHLRKLHQRKNRNINIKKRTIILSVLILFGAIIYFTFAKFESTKSFTLIDAKVGVFYSGYMDGVIATPPAVFDGLVPVTIDDSGETKGTIRIANTNDAWYNYAEHKWANAVIPTREARGKSAGEILSMDEIKQMYVWVPRYRYKLWNAEYGVSDEQAIEIEFEAPTTPKSTGSTNGSWLTHPAFTFGNTELSGFWVGKFEISCNTCTTDGSADSLGTTEKLAIKPGLRPIWGMELKYYHLKFRTIEENSEIGLNSNQVDTHTLENMNWGAIAYLTESKYGRYNSDLTCIDSGCEVWLNFTTKMGCSGNAVSSNDGQCYEWNDQTYGGNTSSTGNVYGIYDLVGGRAEYVLDSLSNTEEYVWSFSIYYSSAFPVPNSKYYKLYNKNLSNNSEFSDGRLGDATREIIKSKGSPIKLWYNSASEMKLPTSSNYDFGPAIVRGASTVGVSSKLYGIKSVGNGSGGPYTARVIISAQDGED